MWDNGCIRLSVKKDKVREVSVATIVHVIIEKKSLNIMKKNMPAILSFIVDNFTYYKSSI